jgi:hypothetical protein
MAPLLQVGEHLVEFVKAQAAAADLGRQQEVFLATQAGIDAPLFRAVTDAKLGDAVRGHADGLATVEHDRTGAPSGQAEDGTQGRGAPRTVAPEQRNALAAAHREVHAVQHVGFAVEGRAGRRHEGIR